MCSWLLWFRAEPQALRPAVSLQSQFQPTLQGTGGALPTNRVFNPSLISGVVSCSAWTGIFCSCTTEGLGKELKTSFGCNGGENRDGQDPGGLGGELKEQSSPKSFQDHTKPSPRGRCLPLSIHSSLSSFSQSSSFIKMLHFCH